MSQPVTEFALVPLKQDVSLDSGEGKTIWDATLKTIASQKGFKRLAWGTQIEHPNVAQMAIDWESIEGHQTFIASDDYRPFLDRLKPIMSDSPNIFHVAFPSSPNSGNNPFDAPVTECLSLYFDTSYDSATYEKSFSVFSSEATKIPGSEVTGLIGGWGIETHKLDGEDEEKKLFGVFIGWPSVEAHMEFRKKEEFPKAAVFLTEGVSGAKMHHVAFKRYAG